MSVRIEIQRDEAILTAEAGWTHGGQHFSDYTVYDKNGKQAQVELTDDEISKLYAKLSEEEERGGDLYEHKYGG